MYIIRQILILVVTFILQFILFKCLKFEIIKINRIDTILEILIPSLISFIGFILTSATVMVGLNKNHIIKMAIKDKDRREELIYYYMLPIVLSICIIITGIIILMVTDESNNMNVHLFSLMNSFSVGLITSTIYLVYILLYIFREDSEEDTEKTKDSKDIKTSI